MTQIVLAVKISLILCFTAFLLSFGGRWNFMLDNLSSFRLHFVIAFSICCLVLLLTKEYRWAGFGAVCTFVGLIPLIGWLIPPSSGRSAASGETPIVVMSSNVRAGNSDARKLVSLVRQERPNVLGLVELNPEFYAGLDSLKSLYPYRLEAPVPGYWGMAIFSDFPLSEENVIHFEEDQPPVMSATLHTSNSAVQLILVHPRSPMTASWAGLRNEQLKDLAKYVAQANLPVIVLGDFNVAMWSPYYRQFVSHSDLLNTRQGASIAGTWPTSQTFGVPIDHVLVSRSLGIGGFRVLPDIGSDHLPILAAVTVAHSDSHANARHKKAFASGSTVVRE